MERCVFKLHQEAAVIQRREWELELLKAVFNSQVSHIVS